MTTPSYRNPRTTVAYLRVSTEDQAQHGVSLGAQEQKVRAYCSALEFGEPEIVCDAGASAKTLNRPAMKALLARIRAGEIERVVISKLDRMTRSVRDLGDLVDLCNKHGTALVSVGETLDTSSAAGRMVMNMLATVAQWERETISERVRDALAHKRTKRNAYGRTPFGYRRDGNDLLPDAFEQSIISEMRSRLDNGESLRSIAADLNVRGIAPHRAKLWDHSAVKAVLRSRITTERVA